MRRGLLTDREIHEKNARLIARVAMETGDVPIRVVPGSLPGDERSLRGIPAIGRSVAGAIPGTSPHAIR